MELICCIGSSRRQFAGRAMGSSAFAEGSIDHWGRGSGSPEAVPKAQATESVGPDVATGVPGDSRAESTMQSAESSDDEQEMQPPVQRLRRSLHEAFTGLAGSTTATTAEAVPKPGVAEDAFLLGGKPAEH
eukprot:CAMPEP_0197661280 /NCGR_PEP_ID=MMETSP1338-20131121/51363_1 /TAXON_ID=43686 ORGANISM="Pelagodinium beii, Strain RCC1491" /NCGR_SAMPLE_ID=MMETSP1338 /ASSEMBLY_ACC=CAM_ASM_000754 /LENGTH=130 /DNA_ID=CAMNT_0043238807 /DNA_START=27 /DNA_END=419 /DNA_ORIENTATION=-